LGTRYWLLIRFISNYLGIGKEFALQLAREGFNIILLARRRSKLEEVKAEI
jgi:short-subunit dehydrogenase